MLSGTLETITTVGMLVFIVAGMAAMGLALTVARIVEPLRQPRLVVGLLVSNFVVVPIAAVLAARVLPMEEPAANAIILIGCAAGAPFLPKLAQLAKGDAGLAVGAMVLLMVVTIAYAPIVVPLLIEGASVDPFEIAQSLVVLMLIPLAIGLFVRARYVDLADDWVGKMSRASSMGLLLGIGGAILVSWRSILESIGSWIFIAAAIVLVIALGAGWLAALGRSTGDRSVAALATAQRNIAAAIVVAVSIGGDTLVYALVGALLIPVVLIVLAGEMGRRAGGARPAAGATLGDADAPPT
jgi:predicted Na+-dependent transporter